MTSNFTLTLQFTDTKNDICKVKVNRYHFVEVCTKLQIVYFTKMLDNYKESTMDKISICVPFAFAMKKMIMSFIRDDKYIWTPIELAELIHCKDFIGMDVDDEFAKLFESTVDIETYDLVHKYIEMKEYSKKMYLRFIATKIPTVYDCSKFSPELQDAILDVTRLNYIVMYGPKSTTFYNTKTDTHHELDIVRKSSGSFEINPTMPIILTGSDWSFALRDLFTGEVLGEKSIPFVPADRVRYCRFANDGKTICVFQTKYIRVYDTASLKQIGEYHLEPFTVEMATSLDCRFVAYTIYWCEPGHGTDRYSKLEILDLQTGETRIIYSGLDPKIEFIDNTTLFYTDAVHKVSETYNLHTDTYHVVEAKSINRNEVWIQHPSSNFRIKYNTNCDPNAESNAVVYDNDRNCLSKILTTGGLYYRSTCCFAYDARHIYSLMKNMLKCQITKHKLDKSGQIILKRTFVIDHDLIDFETPIANVSYLDPNIVEKLKL